MLRLGTDQWVDDMINAAQYLLKEEKSTIDGFQNVLLASSFRWNLKGCYALDNNIYY